MVCRPATSEAGARRPAGSIDLIWTTYLGNYHNCSTLVDMILINYFRSSDRGIHCNACIFYKHVLFQTTTNFAKEWAGKKFFGKTIEETEKKYPGFIFEKRRSSIATKPPIVFLENYDFLFDDDL
jgi:hypothetical protein